MISSKDRSGFFGASDVSNIVGNWNTKTWRKWWLTKLGITSNNIETVAMNAGTNWEHKILESISPVIEMDKQIILPDIRLRVNYDGNIGKHILPRSRINRLESTFSKLSSKCMPCNQTKQISCPTDSQRVITRITFGR